MYLYKEINSVCHNKSFMRFGDFNSDDRNYCQSANYYSPNLSNQFTTSANMGVHTLFCEGKKGKEDIVFRIEMLR